MEFKGKYSFLSNFYPVAIQWEDMWYPSVEHAFQACKTRNRSDRMVIQVCGSAGEAKRLGRSLTLRPGWEEMKVDVMRELVRQKFAHPVLRRKLRRTGDEEIVEGNYHGDAFWGVRLQDGVGQNMLGQILTEIRSGTSRVSVPR